MYKKSTFSVLRRYSDFLWLYETLSMNNPGVVVPPVPDKNTFGRFDEEFVQQRRLGLEKCIQKIANHPVLQKDTDLKLFLESDTFALDVSTSLTVPIIRLPMYISRSNTGRPRSLRRRADSWQPLVRRSRVPGSTKLMR